MISNANSSSITLIKVTVATESHPSTDEGVADSICASFRFGNTAAKHFANLSLELFIGPPELDERDAGTQPQSSRAATLYYRRVGYQIVQSKRGLTVQSPVFARAQDLCDS